jgi:hypothetical protein
MYYETSEVVLLPVELLAELHSLDSVGTCNDGALRMMTMEEVLIEKQLANNYDFTRLSDAVDANGYDPLHVDQDTLTLTDGHHRLVLAIANGVEWLPCIYRASARWQYDCDYDDNEFYKG